ncbi:NADH-ubiquinone oxidoreductase [Arsukibacterium ikkense]|uniref:NADH-ubiquinone oxidoreductase n=1 Tax=Arsukibacterium ikkense TaxID=336831 RepID=A0A0M2V859_9GAMM|nr:NADH-quinone oxidoreductase subunit K [Arsukibacterium ikkense]KKO45348.1 NADH-ubiquinone oxidoreductase [Arsukibacterium ikkense]
MTELGNPLWLYGCSACVLIAIGSYGFIIGPQTLRRILALNIIGAGIFMLMVVLAYRGMVSAADTAEAVVTDAVMQTDAILHALVLTGLVVAVSATAFALALLARLKQRLAKDPPG